MLFLLVAWAPLSVGGWMLTEGMEQRFASEFSQRSQAVQVAVNERFKQLATTLTVAIKRMAADSILKTELLQPLAHRQFYGDPARQRAIVREARRLITSPAVDTLRLVDLQRDGHVIALGHRLGDEAPDAEVVKVATEAANDGVSTTLLMRQDRVDNSDTGEAEEVWTLQVVRVINGPKGRVAIVGGRVLTGALLEALVRAAAGEAHVALDVRGVTVAATFTGEAPPEVTGGYNKQASEVVGRESSGGASGPLATLTVWVKRDGLMKTRQELWRYAGGLGAATGLLALFLGLWFSRRLSRPLEELAEAASLVAEGRRDTVVRERRGNDEVGQLTRAFNQMTLDLAAGEERLRQSERVAAWREIARRIAHEIKNPLFPIQMSIETLQKVWKRQHPDFEEIFEESTETILEEVERMKRIVTEFSDFARMPAPKPVRTDLVGLCSSVVSFHRDVDENVSVSLEAQDGSDDQAVWVNVDLDQLRQVLMNLVQNAVEAVQKAPTAGAFPEVSIGGAPLADPSLSIEEPAPIGHGGAVLVAIGQSGPHAVVTISDDGPGIPEETLGRLFTPYFTTKPTGTGLGLAIVQKIVDEHGGTVRVTSTVGEGATFTITLPLASATASGEAIDADR